MKVTFIYKGAENLGIEYLSAFLKSKGHATSLIYDPAVFSSDVFINSKVFARLLNIDKKVVKTVIASKPDIVAFSAYTGNYKWCLSIARQIKEQINIPIVFGGVHTTAVVATVLENEYVDFAIVGEGEHATIDLINHLSNSRSGDGLTGAGNICFKLSEKLIINKPRPYIQDLDTLPFPDKDLFFKKEPVFLHNPYLIMTSRGCPYACSYCSNNMLQSLYSNERCHIRRRSTGNVITELLDAKRRYGIKSVGFVDDVFTISKSWLEDFVEKYKSLINLPFYCNIHPLAFSKEIARLLKDGGCKLVFLGVQSGSEKTRSQMFLRHESNEQIINAVSYLKEMKIKISVDHIFGAPVEEEVDLRKSLDLYKNIKPDMLLTFWLTYYPGTSIINLAKKFGKLSDSDIRNINEGNIGFAHNTGSADRNRIKLYKKYELLFELTTVVTHNQTYNILSQLAVFLPFKKLFSLCIYMISGIRYFRPWIINKFRYAVSWHNAP